VKSLLRLAVLATTTLLLTSSATTVAYALAPSRTALVNAFASQRLPDGPVTGPALTVAIDGVTVATATVFGSVTPLPRLSRGEHAVQVFLSDVVDPIQEQTISVPGDDRVDIVLGHSPFGGVGLPYVQVFPNRTGAPAGQTRLTLRNVADVPFASILIFGPFTPVELTNVARGEQGSAVLAATFSELKVIPSTGSDPCSVLIMDEFPAKASAVIYAGGLTFDARGELVCAYDAVIHRL
jgi:hypothetical protein